MVTEGSDFSCIMDFGDGHTEELGPQREDYYENFPHHDVKNFRNLEYKFKHRYKDAKSYNLKVCNAVDYFSIWSSISKSFEINI